MPYSISVNIQNSVTGPNGDHAGCYLKVWVTGVTGFADNGVFVFQREITVPETGQRDAYFTNVASVVDMEDLPLGEPLPEDTTTVLFRHSVFEAYFLSRELLDAALVAIQADLNQLKVTASYSEQYLGQIISQTF